MISGRKADEGAPRLLYRDGLMLILDKPAGLAVHPDPRGGETLADHLDQFRFGLPRPPELAHRLDRGTAGCLVLGRHRKALARLGELFASGRVEKTYWAVVSPAPPASEGRIDLALDDKDSVTLWRVQGRSAETAWLECVPLTGRTHQIRLHLSMMGWPILGDRRYGGKPADGLHLLARAVSVPLYPKKPPVAATASVPGHMLAALEECGYAPREGNAAFSTSQP